MEARRALKAAASEYKIYKVEVGRLERIERGLFLFLAIMDEGSGSGGK